MRFIIATLIALVIFGVSSAFAASAYDDVPRDHWAYNALDYLTERGVLEGYPDGFFKGDRTLTRYEFAQAVARLLDTIGNGNVDEQIKVMAESLRAEFSDQLAAINEKLNGLDSRVAGTEDAVADLQTQVGDQGSKINALDEKVNGLKPGPNWKGEFRYRWTFDTFTDPNSATTLYSPAADTENFRQRISFILGYGKKINDAVEINFRLKTQTGNDPTSSMFTMGNGGRTADIFLDRAYVKYTPSWFGYYTDADCKDCTPKLDIYAGIFPNITQDPNEMILDSDVNLQGVGVVYHFNKDFQILTAASVVVDTGVGSDMFGDDAYFYATELKHNNLFICGLDAWLGCYGWKNENYLPGDYFLDNGMRGFDLNGDGLVDGNDRFSDNFNTIKGGLQYTWQCLFDKPFAVYGEYMVNVDSNAEDKIAAWNPFLDPDILYDSSDDIGWVAGAQYGMTPKDCGDWYAYARYKEIGANVVVDGLADADAGGANVNSFELGWAWMWSDNSMMGITYFLNRMHNAFNFLVPSGKFDQQIVQVDWTFKF